MNAKTAAGKNRTLPCCGPRALLFRQRPRGPWIHLGFVANGEYHNWRPWTPIRSTSGQVTSRDICRNCWYGFALSTLPESVCWIAT